MTRIASFAPVIGRNPRILILGSMPGVASLEAVQYYAHPRNAFWPIMGELFDFDANTDYPGRIARIAERPLILWDTLQSCVRPGSLDSAIERNSVRANDIPGLLRDHPGIRAIAFNGASSAQYFRRLVLADLDSASVELLQLPSTSPANAGMSYSRKRDAWRQVLEFLD